MKTTGLKTVIVLLAASLILAGEALAGGGGGGFRRGGGGPGPAWQGAAPVNPQEQGPGMGPGPGGGAPGPQGRGDGPRANVPQARGGLGGNYAFCPYCGAPCPRSRMGPGTGIGRGLRPNFQNGGGMPGPNFQRGAWGPWGRGIRREGAMRRPGPMFENWGRGAWQGRGGQGFAPQGQAPANRDERGWRQGGDGGRSGPDALTPPRGENEDDFWAPPQWQRGGRGRGPGMYPPDGFDVPPAPEVTAPQKPEAPQVDVQGPEAP